MSLSLLGLGCFLLVAQYSQYDTNINLALLRLSLPLLNITMSSIVFTTLSFSSIYDLNFSIFFLESLLLMETEHIIKML